MLEVCSAEAETPDTLGLLLRPVGAASVPFYEPGQFLIFRIPREGGAVARCYSLASSPYLDAALYVVVKRMPGGYASNWLCDNARPGLRLEALAPAGRFVPSSLDEDLLLIAGGSGITPIFSIAKSILFRGGGRLTLIDVNRDEDSIIFHHAIDGLLGAFRGRFAVTHWLTSQRGRVDAFGLERLTTAHGADAAFICGPAGLTDVARQALRLAGFAPDRIYVETFKSLTRDPFGAPQRQNENSLEGAVALEVNLGGTVHHLMWPPDMPLLDVMLSNGIEAPHFCRDGACGTCMCVLRQGRVRMARPEIYGDNFASGDQILACQTLPGGERVKIAY